MSNIKRNPTANGERQEPLWLTRLISKVLNAQASSGLFLIAAAAVALAWSNSPWADQYVAILHHKVEFAVGRAAFAPSVEWIINDILMVLFFFVVGLEIKLEIYDGELAGWRRAALPTIAALGGMAVPAVVYLVTVAGHPGIHSGWGVPMATDIAFAVGVLALLGRRVPPALRILLLALAVIDDLGAIIVIALFYSTGVSWLGLAIAALGVLAVLGLRSLTVNNPWVYVLPAVVIWYGIHAAGVHPTIAGVIIGLLTPVRPLKTANRTKGKLHTVSPAEYLVSRLHPWVSFGIMPIFALANAGVPLSNVTFDSETLHAAAGIGLGLLIGKPLGIVLVSLAVVKLGWVGLPKGVGVRHLILLGIVAGIGFTMSLFVAQLAFAEPAHLNAARLAIVATSAVAALLSIGAGYLLLLPQKLLNDRETEPAVVPQMRPSS